MSLKVWYKDDWATLNLFFVPMSIIYKETREACGASAKVKWMLEFIFVLIISTNFTSQLYGPLIAYPLVFDTI